MEQNYDGGRSESPPSELQVIVCDILRHRLQQDSLEWENCPIPMTTPNKTCRSLRRVVDDFRRQYEGHFEQMFSELEFERDPAQAEAAYLGIVSELFRETIKWSYVVALLVLSGEFASIFAARRWTELLNSVHNWTVNYISTHLNTWIQEHGGWEYMVHHYGEDLEEDYPAKHTNWSRFRHLVAGVAAGALGVLTLKAVLSKNS